MKISNLLRRCLQKDKRQRYYAAGDVRVEIEEALAHPNGPDAAVLAHQKYEYLPWAAAAVLGLIAIVLGVGFVLRAPQPPQPAPPGRQMANLGWQCFNDISPVVAQQR